MFSRKTCHSIHRNVDGNHYSEQHLSESLRTSKWNRRSNYSPAFAGSRLSKKMIADSIDLFHRNRVRGKTLSGFMKKIDKDVKCMNIDKVADLDKVLEGVAMLREKSALL